MAHWLSGQPSLVRDRSITDGISCMHGGGWSQLLAWVRSPAPCPAQPACYITSPSLMHTHTLQGVGGHTNLTPEERAQRQGKSSQ
jgi:hypothetical protein